MKQSRRRFLFHCGGCALSLFAMAPFSYAMGRTKSRAAVPTHRKERFTLQNVNRASMEPLLHSFFDVSDEGKSLVTVQLIEVKEDLSCPRLEQLSLLFRGPKRPALPQKIYIFRHDAIDDLGIFIVPIGQDREGVLYQAIFNRLKN